jgi:tetratricopeptide (TPR) repeat protein
MGTLEEYRKNKESWIGVVYKEVHSDDRGSYDANEKARYALLIQLQYDFQESDRELIRFLFEQEVIAREKDDFQGIGNALWLGAFLLAKFKDPADISLFYRAKNSNFDTYCGFDVEFVFWPLKGDTDSYLAENHPEILNDLGGVYFESGLDETINEWWDGQISQYPDCVEKELPLVLYERNLYFDDIEKAKEYLDLWASNEPESDRKQSYLKYAYKQIGEFGKAIEIVKKSIDLKDPGWDKAGAYRDLLELYTQAGAPSDALEYIERIDTEFKKFDNWKQAGLGHMTVKSVFDYSKASNDPSSGKKAFKYANAWGNEVNKLPVAVLEAGMQAAEKWNMYFKAKKYKKLAEQERARIDSM